MKKETITAESPSIQERIIEIINYRDLFFALASRDFKIKYTQTYLGTLWAFLQPLATILIFSLVFDKVLKIETKGIPYPLFITVGMSSWSYFSIVMQQSGGSIISAQNMVQKIYFPRLILPMSKAFVGLSDFIVGWIFLICAMIFYQYLPPFNILFYPFIFIWLVITALGTGIWLSSLTIKYRDFQYILPFLVQFGLYATPVGYTLDNISSFRILFYLNPMTGILELSRWSILGIGSFSPYIFLSLGISILIFTGSIWHFGRTELKLADII